MCLDILAKYLGSSPNWTTTLADTLQETVGFSTQVASSIEAAYLLLSSSASPEVLTTATPSKSKKSKKEKAGPVVEIVSASAIAAAKNSYPELLKLQGSVFLSSGTICGTVGPRSLPYLAVLGPIHTMMTYYFHMHTAPAPTHTYTHTHTHTHTLFPTCTCTAFSHDCMALCDISQELLSNILSCIEAQGVNLIADERHRARATAAERAGVSISVLLRVCVRAGKDEDSAVYHRPSRPI